MASEHRNRKTTDGSDRSSLSSPGVDTNSSHYSFQQGETKWISPGQIALVHEVHRHDLASPLSYLSFSNTAIQSGKTSQRRPSVNAVYPGIPFQVAHYICESNPELLNQMEAVLHGSKGSSDSQRQTGTAGADEKNLKITSFQHMRSVSDALALQESVIGGSVKKPASLDVVAQVVANVRNQQISARQQDFRFSDTVDGDRMTDHLSDSGFQMGQETISDRPAPHSGTISPMLSGSHQLDFSYPEMDNTLNASKELHRFPKHRITTVVERRSWWSAKSKEEEGDSGVHDQEVISESSSRRSSVSTREKVKDDSTTTLNNSDHAWKSRESRGDVRSVASEVESVVSERYDLESNYSEKYDLQSNSSEVSGLEEEMFRIKKLLLEVPNHQESMALGTLVDDGRSVDRQVHFELLREKASLEGQVEALTAELGRANQEKTALRAQLMTCRTQVSSQAGAVRISKQEALDIKAKMTELEKVLAESEDSIARLRGSLETKTEAAIQSATEAKIAEEEAQQLKILLQELRVEAESRDGAVRGLKTKVTELHVELQNALQAKSRLESDLQVSKSRTESEQNMKEWYRQQLQESQTAKGKLHQDIITLKAFCAECESSADKLRFERDQSRLHLSELKERGVREKETLLRHLKTIEADVRERETVFQQFQKEQGSTEEVVAAQLLKLEQEKVRLKEEAFSMAELRQSLDAARAEVDSKMLDINRLDKEVAQLMQQVTVQNKTIGEREQEIHLVRERVLGLEAKIKEQQVALQESDERLATAKREVVARDAELTSIRVEKGDMDATLVEVRGNVLKLDGRLKQMKEDLAAKTTAAQELRQERANLVERLQMQTVVAEQLKAKWLKSDEEAKMLRGELRKASEARVEVEEAKERAAVAQTGAQENKETADRLSDDLNRLVNENRLLKEKIDALENFDVSQATRDDLAFKLTTKLTETLKTLQSKEQELQEALHSNGELSSSLAELTEARAVIEKMRQREQEVERTSEDHALLLQDKLVEKEESLLRAMTATRAAEMKLELVSHESDSLKRELQSKIEELEGLSVRLKSYQGDVAFSSFGTQTESLQPISDRPSGEDDTVIALTSALRNVEAEIQEQRRRYESNINVLTRKLKTAIKNSKKLEEEVKELEKKLAEKVTLQNSVDVSSASVTSPTQQMVDFGNRSKDVKMTYYRKKISLLELKVTELQRLCEDEKQRANKAQDILIDMEKQRGKLDALAKNSTSLRQQAFDLEAALSERENALSELDLQTRDAETRKRQEEGQLRDILRETQKKLAIEQEAIRELRKQVFKEKCESSGLKKEVASLKSILEVANRSLDVKKSELTTAERDLDDQHRSILKLQAEIGDLELKLAKSKEEVDRLKKDVETGQAKDPLLADQIKSLSWHLREKNQELSSVQEQLKQVDERHRLELKRMEQALQSSKRELDDVRTELITVSEERLSYQTKVTELRAALKASMKHRETTQAKALPGKNLATNEADVRFLESPAPYDESLIASLLQQSLSLPEISRPLSNLQICVNTLKQEMAILQQQLLEQTNGES